MQAIHKTSPYIRKEVNTARMMTDVIIALLPVTIFAIYRFGSDALIRIFISMSVMVVLEAIAFGMLANIKKSSNLKENITLRYKKYTKNNVIIPALSGLLFALIIPSKLPLHVVIIGASFGILVGKMMFGGTGKNIFNVAAVGRIFIGLAFGGSFSNAYPGVDLIAGSTALGTSKSLINFDKVFDSYTMNQLFLGDIPGSMGEISALLIILGGVYLIVRRSADFRLILGSLIPFVLLTFVAGVVLNETNPFDYMLFQLFAGGILFGSVFMITDPVTAPLNALGRIFYGLLFATITVLIRVFGVYPEGVAFAILISNIFVSWIDYPNITPQVMTKKYVLVYAATLVTALLAIFFGLGGL